MTNLTKSEGITRTERLLAELCDQTFLRLWSYPNPHRDDGKELCDLLVVFEDDVLIFFDRENRGFDSCPDNIDLAWTRWRREVVDKQITTTHGAERYIRSGRQLYLDARKSQAFPIPINLSKARFHKIVVAHGVRDACKHASPMNVSGSLAISYEPADKNRAEQPFFIEIDRDNPVHILDSENLEIALSELDTIYDFTAYLRAKIEAVQRHTVLTYCGEEDVIAHYFINFDSTRKKHIIGSYDDFDTVHIGEGEWADFQSSSAYIRRKEADRSSYFWDNLIQITSDNALKGMLLGDSEPFNGKSAIHFMAKEPRFVRRGLSDHMRNAVRSFPENDEQIVRHVCLMPSFFEGTAYVFLQLKAIYFSDHYNEYREKRAALLEVACGAAKLKQPNLQRVIGIATDAPKYAGNENSEDMLLMEFNEWDPEKRAYFEAANNEWQFFSTPNLTLTEKTLYEFPELR